MKRLLSISTSLILIAGVSFWFYQSNNTQNNKAGERQAYEQFLLDSYKDLPQLNEEEESKEKRPDMPEMAGIRDYFLTMDPATKQVPVERLPEARKLTDAAHTRTFDPMPEWEYAEANSGGRTRTVMWDPNDDNHTKVWSGSVTGGLWYNDDITFEDSQWTPVEDMWASLSISVITYDPNNTQVFYVGTGEAETARTIYRESSGVGVGIYKSMDGGENWELLASTERFKYITDIAVRNEDGQSVIYASAASGFYKGQTHESNTNGLWRSEDGGESWEQVLPLIPGDEIPYAVSDIEIGADNKLYVGSAATVDHKGGAVIFTSTEGTEGSWTVFSDYQQLILAQSFYKYPERVVLASAPSDPGRVYAAISVGYEDTDGFIKYQSQYILRSDNKGETWEEINLPPAGQRNWAYLSWHAMILKVHPEDANHIYAGGLDLHMSPNGGTSWNLISDWALMYYGGGDEYVHGDQHDIAFNPANTDQAIFATDGGVFLTYEASSVSPAFIESSTGFNTLQFYTCALHPEDLVFLGGLQDNGTFRYDGEPMNMLESETTGGDGAYCFFDQDEPNNWITTVYYTTVAGWEGINLMSYNQWSRGTFVNPMAYDSKQNALYGNSCRFNGELNDQIYRINGLPRDQGISAMYLNTGTTVPFTSLMLSPNHDDESVLFIGSQSGRLFRIDNAHNDNYEWTEITGDDFPVATISSVAVAYGDDDNLLVTFSNYGVASVWQTFDGGESWENVEGNLPDIPVRWALYHPEGSSQAMIATETGVWISKNLDQENPTWAPGGINYPNVRTDMLQMRESDNVVLAATHGRGLMYTSWDFDHNVGVADLENPELMISPNPATNIIRLSGEKSLKEFRIYDLSGKKLLGSKAQQKQEINIENLNAGSYIVEIVYEDGSRAKQKLIKK